MINTTGGGGSTGVRQKSIRRRFLKINVQRLVRRYLRLFLKKKKIRLKCITGKTRVPERLNETNCRLVTVRLQNGPMYSNVLACRHKTIDNFTIVRAETDCYVSRCFRHVHDTWTSHITRGFGAESRGCREKRDCFVHHIHTIGVPAGYGKRRCKLLWRFYFS